MNGFVEVLKQLGPQRLAAMGAVTIALIGFFVYVIFRVSQPAMVTLFTDLTIQDSSSIMRELDTRGIRYELRQDGGTIMVPKEQSLRLRMDLAAKGMPLGGSIGYEIFDKGDAFSTTSFVQNVNHVRALEGELARTIRTIDRVSQARVHLVLPERQLFSRDKNEARASIIVKTRGDLDSGQIRAIRHLVATAVTGLKPAAVSIVDEAGRLLADGANGEDNPGAMADEKQGGYERRVRGQVEDIVASIVGRGRARVQVAADMDFNRVQQTTENYDPESRVVRSTQSRNETATTTSAGAGQVSANNELPGGDAAAAQGGGKDGSNKTEEIVNYEISRTTRTEVIEAGRVKRLSVAVLVDGNYAKGTGPELTYQPRPQEELDRIAALVRSAIGFDKNRGDTVEVVNLKFAEAPAVIDIKEMTFMERMLNFSKDDIMRLTELGVLGLVSLFVLLLVVRPLVKEITAPEKGKGGKGGAAGGAAALQAIASAAPPGMTIAGIPGNAMGAAEEMIEVNQVTGALQAKSMERVGAIVNKNPQESIAILRQYIHGRPGAF